MTIKQLTMLETSGRGTKFADEEGNIFTTYYEAWEDESYLIEGTNPDNDDNVELICSCGCTTFYAKTRYNDVYPSTTIICTNCGTEEYVGE